MVRGKNINVEYALNQIKENWNDWTWYYYQFTNHILPQFYKLRENNGTYFVEKEWDTLIILDGCRYDLFEEYIDEIDIDGDLKAETSRGSATPEFLLENFEGGEFEDIVYISSNPFVYTLLDEPFHEVVHVWKEGWSDDFKTVEPQTVTEAAIDAAKQYPSKRIIVHYMQPHCPFIGDYKKDGNFWQVALKDGKDEVMKAYKSNLELVIPCVEEIVKKVNGKTVVTADHGNANGEKALGVPIYGHPGGVHIPVLVKVPWFEIEASGIEDTAGDSLCL